MKYFKKLVGERIYLSPLNIEDAKQYVEWLSDFKTSDGVGKSSQLITIETEVEWLKGVLENSKFNFSIVDLKQDVLLGNCDIRNIDYIHQTAEIGIFIGDEKNRGMGYGSEAINLLLDYGFNYLNLKNIMLGVKSFNERAINCYKKVGFKEIGKRRKSFYLNGKYYDYIYMDILADEFEGNYIKNKNI